MSAVKTAVVALSFFLAFAFFMGGINKIAPLHAPTHATMVQASQAWPAALHLDSIGVDATTLRVAIGFFEVVAAVVLLTPAASTIAYGLMIVMLGAIYTHYRLDESVAPPAVMLTFLVSLVVLRVQLRKESATLASEKTD
jgi:uncharacterized membrane protein YphA (DoxX/SURF4 family)